MIRIWCEECNGKGTVFPNVMARDECDNCNGKGYTEHEGSLEDLELGLAVREFCKRDADKLYYYDYIDNLNEITLQEFVEWYKDQKGDTE